MKRDAMILVYLMLCVAGFDFSQAAQVKATTPGTVDHIEIVRNQIGAWRKAWEGKDIDNYMSFYSPDFISQGLDYSGMKAKTEIMFKKKGDISFSVSDLWVFIEDEEANASFVQRYSNPAMGKMGEKTLILRKTGQDWKIISESWKSLTNEVNETSKTITTKPTVPVGAVEAVGKSRFPYTIQLGSFSTRKQALDLAQELNQKGEIAFTSVAHLTGRGVYHRVFAGFYAEMAEADAQALRLKAQDVTAAKVIKRPYALQIGSFRTENSLNTVAQRLRSKGYIGYQIPVPGEEGMFRLMVGAFKTRKDAVQLTEELKAAGFTPQLVLR
jgi:cell division septation protein DedD/ketosteroid isomerase-like protein